jgi:hypothetical protein
MPGLLEIFVRHALVLEWNWANRSDVYKEISTFEWHSLLVDYVESHGDAVEKGGDEELLNKTVEKYVLPFLTRFLKGTATEQNGVDITTARHPAENKSAFNPFSGQQTRRLTQAIDNMTYYFDDDQLVGGPFRKLMESVRDRLHAVIDHCIKHRSGFLSSIRDESPAMGSDTERLSAWKQSGYNSVALFVNAMHLLQRHAHHLGGSFGQVAQQVGLGHYVDLVLLPHIQVGRRIVSGVPGFAADAITLLERIVDASPEAWYAHEWIFVKNTVAQLVPVIEMAVSERYVRLLIKIHAYDLAATIGKRFNATQ